MRGQAPTRRCWTRHGQQAGGAHPAVACAVRLLATRMGSEFVPSLNEGDFAIQALRIPAPA
jgi:Cu/Ag efflux pump CusA